MNNQQLARDILDKLSIATCDVIAERRRQIESEGWTPEHDDGHGGGPLATAAATYALTAASALTDQLWWGPEFRRIAEHVWPWDTEWLKPTTPRRDLVKAAALIIAEIERIDRSPFERAVPAPDPGQLERCPDTNAPGPQGGRCGLPAGHDGAHTLLIPTGLPWDGIRR